MSAHNIHVLLNLLSELGKSDKMLGFRVNFARHLKYS